MYTNGFKALEDEIRATIKARDIEKNIVLHANNESVFYSFYSRFNMTKNLKTETCPYLRKFGIVCPNSTVLFEPYYDKEKQEYVYSNTQLIDWLKEKTSYIDSVFEKVSQVQKKKSELEADFKENIFDENEIETIIGKNKNK